MTKLVLFAWMTALTAGAELEWAQKSVTLQVHPTQMSADAVFNFTNTGDEPASIRDIKITCGCLAAKPVKDHYAPGESGQVVVMFNLEGRKGKQNKQVEVTTDGGQHVDLSIAADIPEAYHADTSVLLWKKGDEARQKTIHLTNLNPMPIGLHSITSSLKGLPAELKTIREGFEYEVTVSRNTEGRNARSVVRIKMDPPPGQTESKELKYYVIAM